MTSARRAAGLRVCWWARLSRCISAFTCARLDLYFVAAYEAGKHALCCLETMPFDTRGALWFDSRADPRALFIALVVQLVVLWFNFTNKGFWPVIGGIPILLMEALPGQVSPPARRADLHGWRGAGCR